MFSRVSRAFGGPVPFNILFSLFSFLFLFFSFCLSTHTRHSHGIREDNNINHDNDDYSDEKRRWLVFLPWPRGSDGRPECWPLPATVSSPPRRCRVSADAAMGKEWE